MNNYCSNCGKKLSKSDYYCSECNTPVIDLPEKEPSDKEKFKVMFWKIVGKILIILVLLIGLMYTASVVIKYTQVKTFLAQNYEGKVDKISFDSFGRCVSSGDCYADPVMGCDGGSCTPYKYVNNCYAFFYSFKDGNKKGFVNVPISFGGLKVNKGQYYGGTDFGIATPRNDESTNAPDNSNKDENVSDEIEEDNEKYKLIGWSKELEFNIDEAIEYEKGFFKIGIDILNDNNIIVNVSNNTAPAYDVGIRVVFYKKGHVNIGSTSIIPFATKLKTGDVSSPAIDLNKININYKEVESIMIALYRFEEM